MWSCHWQGAMPETGTDNAAVPRYQRHIKCQDVLSMGCRTSWSVLIACIWAPYQARKKIQNIIEQQGEADEFARAKANVGCHGRVGRFGWAALHDEAQGVAVMQMQTQMQMQMHMGNDSVGLERDAQGAKRGGRQAALKLQVQGAKKRLCIECRSKMMRVLGCVCCELCFYLLYVISGNASLPREARHRYMAITGREDQHAGTLAFRRSTGGVVSGQYNTCIGR